MSTNLEKRIFAIESVILRAPRSIGVHAVDHLIAFPDEEMKVGALVRLSPQLPEGEPKTKVDHYLGDYLAFLHDAEESYPNLAAGLSKGAVFALRRFEVKKGGVLELKELLDSADCSFSSSKSYAEALIDYGLEAGNDEYFKRGMQELTPEVIYGNLRGRFPKDRQIQLDLAQLLLQSENNEVCLAGIGQMPKDCDTEIKLSAAFKNYQRLNDFSEGKEFLEQVIPAAYEKSPDKCGFVRNFFDIDPISAAVLAKRLAGEKNTFSEIYDIAVLVMKHSRKDAVTILDRAISAERTYENIVKAAQTVSDDGDLAAKYFEQALQTSAELSEDLAGRFYEKSLGQEKSAEDYRDLVKHCLQLGSKKLARRFVAEAEQAGLNYAGNLAGGVGGAADNIKESVPVGIPKVTNTAHFLVLENIVCVDAEGRIFERYPKLAVQKDLFRDAQNQQINLTPYNAAVHCEQNGLFLPSFALTCNIIAALYQNKNDAEAKKLLGMYKNKGNGNGWHAQSTVINWGTQQIIHYPRDSDFPAHGGRNNINQSQPQQKLSFDRTGFGDKTLAEALQIPNFKRYAQNLTGLQNPSILVDVGNYFGKTPYVWISSSNETRAAWLGCYDNDFDLSGSNYLSDYGAARGVRREGA